MLHKIAAQAVTESDIDIDYLINFNAGYEKNFRASNPFTNLEAKEASSSKIWEPPQNFSSC